MASTLCNKAFTAPAVAQRSSRRAVVVRAQAQDVSRRAALGALAGAAALVSGAAPVFAEFGDSANVFGKVTNKSGFVPYAGDGFALLLPSKWNPAKERDFNNVILRYEDNFDAVNNLIVISQPSDKKSIEDFGDQLKFLNEVSYLFGKQAFSGETQSEGGFAPNRVSAASLLENKITTDKKGTKFYEYEVLTRTADGNEGGRHHLIKAGVVGGKLWLIKAQVGDKRWFKGVNKEAYGAINSFTIA